MEIKFFPLDFEYRLKDGNVYMYLYSKLEDGSRVCVIHEHRPFFYVSIEGINTTELELRLKGLKVENRGEAAQVIELEEVERELLGKKKKLWKIFANYPQAVPLLAGEIQSWGLECFEKDILFVHRYLRDVGIMPMTLVVAQGEFIDEPRLRIPAFLATDVHQESLESVQKLRILAVDIETYALKKEILPQKNPILMIGLYGVDELGQEFKKVLTWKKFPHTLEYLEVCDSETQLLQRFRDIVLEYHPDILTGYYSDVFDLPYIKVRAQKLGVQLDLGADHSELEVSEKGVRESKSSITSMVHVDVFQFIRNIFGKNLKTGSFSLDAVSEELLGYKKQVVNLDELGPSWDSNSERLADFCAYNLHDAYLTAQLCRTLLYDMIEFTKIVGVPVFDVIRMKFSRLVENYILRRGMEYNILAPNKPQDAQISQRRQESIQGAFVFEPTPGLYKDMVVFDFRSLYPTIISAHNIGPEGFRCDCCKLVGKVPEKEEYWFCTKEKKFIPLVLEELILRRADVKRMAREAQARGEDTKIYDARSYTIKVLANSFYGYLGFYGARWYSIECAASTTAYARNYIKQTIEKAREFGFEVIYADTDSCFVLLGDKELADAKDFMQEVNSHLPGKMELEMEGYYPRGIFVAIKGTEKGAKKKYALISKEGRVKVTGFESVRRNWSLIAKEVQKKVLELVLNDKVDDALVYVKLVVQEMKRGLVPLHKLIIKTQITRELGGYASVGPHVAVARRMVERGEMVVPGMVVEYVIVKGPGIIRERAKLPSEVGEGEYDADYYLNNQVIPAVSSIFLVLGYTEDQVFKDDSQTGLGKFF